MRAFRSEITSLPYSPTPDSWLLAPDKAGHGTFVPFTHSVLRDGRSIGTIPGHGFREDELIQMMVGRKIDDMYPRSHRPSDEVVLAVENLRLLPSATPFSLTVRRGEVVGISGLVGSGRTELLKRGGTLVAEPTERKEMTQAAILAHILVGARD